MFHLIGALSEFGKLGVLAIGDTEEKAYASYLRSVRILERLRGEASWRSRQASLQPSGGPPDAPLEPRGEFKLPDKPPAARRTRRPSKKT